MEVKKSPAANLENRKFLLLAMGVVCSLSTILISLEWTQTLPKLREEVVVAPPPEEVMIATVREVQPPPPPPPPPSLSNEILVVKDEIKIEENLDFNSDINQDTKVVNFQQTAAPVVVEEDVDDRTPFVIVEKMPEFPGPGTIMQWIGKNLKYPAIAAENGIQGRVTVSFVIEKDGSISDVKVGRGVDSNLDKEAVRVVKSMPKWKPGKQRGKEVRVSYSVPISFVLK